MPRAARVVFAGKCGGRPACHRATARLDSHRTWALAIRAPLGGASMQLSRMGPRAAASSSRGPRVNSKPTRAAPLLHERRTPGKCGASRVWSNHAGGRMSYLAAAARHLLPGDCPTYSGYECAGFTSHRRAGFRANKKGPGVNPVPFEMQSKLPSILRPGLPPRRRFARR